MYDKQFALFRLSSFLGERYNILDNEYLGYVLDDAMEEALLYCNRKEASIPLGTIVLMALTKINRNGSEGIATQSIAGNSEAFTEFYPAEVVNVLNKYRRLKTI